MESDYHSPVNIGNPGEFTILEFAKTILELTESKSNIVFSALPKRPGAAPPDITRARAVLGWEPQVSLRDGLEMMLDQSSRAALVGAGGHSAFH